MIRESNAMSVFIIFNINPIDVSIRNNISYVLMAPPPLRPFM